MLCQKCHKNQATTRYAEVVDGQVTHLQLCAECLGTYQEGNGTGFELSGPAPGPRLGSVTRNAREAPELKSTCRACGLPLKTVVETAAVGCAACYDSFSVHLEGILEGLHVALRHRGKVPRLDDERVRLRSELQTKRSLLRHALSSENYEAAAALRDEIQVLELGLGVSGVEQDQDHG